MCDNVTDEKGDDEPIGCVHHKNVQEADEPIFVFVGFFFHITIALNEGLVKPLVTFYLVSLTPIINLKLPFSSISKNIALVAKISDN